MVLPRGSTTQNHCHNVGGSLLYMSVLLLIRAIVRGTDRDVNVEWRRTVCRLPAPRSPITSRRTPPVRTLSRLRPPPMLYARQRARWRRIHSGSVEALASPRCQQQRLPWRTRSTALRLAQYPLIIPVPRATDSHAGGRCHCLWRHGYGTGLENCLKDN